MFHRWIREQAIPELLIDVADYAHVPAGPGIMIIGHEAHYSVDNRENRLGAAVQPARRVGWFDAGAHRAGLRSGTWAARTTRRRNPKSGGHCNFDEHDVEIWVNDRLLAPNDPETIAEFKSEVSSFLAHRFGSAPDLRLLQIPAISSRSNSGRESSLSTKLFQSRLSSNTRFTLLESGAMKD